MLGWISGSGGDVEGYKIPDGGNFVQGVAHPIFITQPDWLWLRARYNAGEMHRPGDVWVVAYPKSGTTLTEQIVLLLRSNGDPSGLNPGTHNAYDPAAPDQSGKVWVERTVRPDPRPAIGDAPPELDVSGFGRMPGPRLLKSHAPRQLFLATVPLAAAAASAAGAAAAVDAGMQPAAFSVPGRPAALASGAKVIYICLLYTSPSPRD